MAYNEKLADRIAAKLIELNALFIEKKMFGGLTFMMQDKMCIGVVKDEIMLRVLDEKYDALLEKNYVKPMQFTGKTMKGFLFIEAEAFDREDDFENWIKLGIEFAEVGALKSKKSAKK